MRARRTSMAPGYVRSFGSNARDRVTRARPGPPPSNVIRYTVRARAASSPRTTAANHAHGLPSGGGAQLGAPVLVGAPGPHVRWRHGDARYRATGGAGRAAVSTLDREPARPASPAFAASTVPAGRWASRSRHIPPRGQTDSPLTRTCAVARCPATRHPKQRLFKHSANERLRESRAVYGLSNTSLIGRATRRNFANSLLHT